MIAKEQRVPDEAIICEAKVETTKTSGPKKNPIPAAVKTTKQINNKIAKLMPAIAEAMQHEKSEVTETDPEENEDDEDESEEED